MWKKNIVNIALDYNKSWRSLLGLSSHVIHTFFESTKWTNYKISVTRIVVKYWNSSIVSVKVMINIENIFKYMAHCVSRYRLIEDHIKCFIKNLKPVNNEVSIDLLINVMFIGYIVLKNGTRKLFLTYYPLFKCLIFSFSFIAVSFCH